MPCAFLGLWQESRKARSNVQHCLADSTDTVGRVGISLVCPTHVCAQTRDENCNKLQQSSKMVPPPPMSIPPAMGYRCVCTTGAVQHKAEVQSKSQRGKVSVCCIPLLLNRDSVKLLFPVAHSLEQLHMLPINHRDG